MFSTGFFIPSAPTIQYEELIKQLERDLRHAEAEGRILAEKHWKRHWRLSEGEWAKMVGLKKSTRHPCLETLKNSRAPGNTPVPNQDHASIWVKGRTPMMLVSMPNTKAPANHSEDQVRAFEKQHKVKRYQMPFPGWHNPRTTTLEFWVLD